MQKTPRRGSRDKNKMKITLPMPPSINKAYANCSRGRFKSKEYKDWENLCDSLMAGKKTHTFEFDRKGVIIDYTFYSKWLNNDGSVKMKDLSNYFKCLEDYLPRVLIDFDDKYIWGYDKVRKMHSGREEVEINIIETSRFVSKK